MPARGIRTITVLSETGRLRLDSLACKPIMAMHKRNFPKEIQMNNGQLKVDRYLGKDHISTKFQPMQEKKPSQAIKGSDIQGVESWDESRSEVALGYALVFSFIMIVLMAIWVVGSRDWLASAFGWK